MFGLALGFAVGVGVVLPVGIVSGGVMGVVGRFQEWGRKVVIVVVIVVVTLGNGLVRGVAGVEEEVAEVDAELAAPNRDPLQVGSFHVVGQGEPENVKIKNIF